MAGSNSPAGGSDLTSVIDATYLALKGYVSNRVSKWLFVDTVRQEIFLVRESTILNRWPVSTAETGLDNRENSGGTPPGVHRIAQKIGSGAAWGTVFESREPTGEIWNPAGNAYAEGQKTDLILSRILILDGLEPGVNKGAGIDSRQRYIYVHGTNHPHLIGQPAGGGCVRMENQNLIDLFEEINEGDLLVIV